MPFILGFCLSTIFALLAWRVGALSTSGALAAALTGGLIFGAGGWPWASLLLALPGNARLLLTEAGGYRLAP